MIPVRGALVRLHRWTGLVLAGFLVVVGLTGIPLAWYGDLDRATAPGLHDAAAPAPGAAPLDVMVLRERVRQAWPGALMPATPLSVPAGGTLAFPVWAQTGEGAPVLHEVFIDPYTGEIRGDRRWGDASQGLRNLMPVLHRIHAALMVEGVGELLLGIVALLWTLDGFVGAWLTLPARAAARPGAPGWWQRWRPAWQLRLRSGAHKRNFDLHRAGGLWLWGALTAMAWSSVALSLPQVYDPVMRQALAYQPDPRRQAASPQRVVGTGAGAPATGTPAAGTPAAGTPATGTPAAGTPATGTPAAASTAARSGPSAPMETEAARAVGRRLMAGLAAHEGFEVRREHWLALDARRNLYRYTVVSTRDLRERSGATSVYFRADSGDEVGHFLPRGRAAGDSVKHWLTSLHMAAMWGWPLRVAVALVGVVTVLLSVTGVWLWAKRRRAQALARQRQRPRA
ncbi:PepSY-associated TM helix domain-containing protein [Bordetella genomosp. 5]|uniref:PepSY-associated TM helix domain-containing protein n=1 Tax=Bordetella genomosp. 5 TaxID=1395608 RepID=UPI001482F954|nr:PepSY-associated TM helix domain-containing protein [Bordetella genomosp. 5]